MRSLKINRSPRVMLQTRLRTRVVEMTNKELWALSAYVFGHDDKDVEALREVNIALLNEQMAAANALLETNNEKTQ